MPPDNQTEKRAENCPLCENSGWVLEEKEGVECVRRCDCYRERHKKILLAAARIPCRYRHCSLKGFEIEPRGKTPPHLDPDKFQVNLGMAKDIAVNFVKKYPKVEKGLLFMGKCGVGKTHLAVAIMNDLIEKKGVPCAFYDFRDLLTEIKGTYAADSSISEVTILRPVLDKEVLVLDELGAQKVTEWMRDTLTYIINQRYNEKRHTIITSNWLDDAEDEEDTLIGRIGYRLRSRLYEMCQVVEIVGDDYRKSE